MNLDSADQEKSDRHYKLEVMKLSIATSRLESSGEDLYNGGNGQPHYGFYNDRPKPL